MLSPEPAILPVAERVAATGDLGERTKYVKRQLIVLPIIATSCILLCFVTPYLLRAQPRQSYYSGWYHFYVSGERILHAPFRLVLELIGFWRWYDERVIYFSYIAAGGFVAQLASISLCSVWFRTVSRPSASNVAVPSLRCIALLWALAILLILSLASGIRLAANGEFGVPDRWSGVLICIFGFCATCVSSWLLGHFFGLRMLFLPGQQINQRGRLGAKTSILQLTVLMTIVGFGLATLRQTSAIDLTGISMDDVFIPPGSSSYRLSNIDWYATVALGLNGLLLAVLVSSIWTIVLGVHQRVGSVVVLVCMLLFYGPGAALFFTYSQQALSSEGFVYLLFAIYGLLCMATLLAILARFLGLRIVAVPRPSSDDKGVESPMQMDSPFDRSEVRD